MLIHTCAFGAHDPEAALRNASTFIINNNKAVVKVWTSLDEFPSDLPDYGVFSQLALKLGTPYLQSILARVYALYSYGGLYVDDDMTSLKLPSPAVTLPGNVLVLVRRDEDIFHEGIFWGAICSPNPQHNTLRRVMDRMLACCSGAGQVTGHGRVSRSIVKCLTKEVEKSSDPILLLPSSVVVRYAEEASNDALILAGRPRYPVEHVVAKLFRMFVTAVSDRQTELLYRFITTVIIGLLATVVVAAILSKFKKDHK